MSRQLPLDPPAGGDETPLVTVDGTVERVLFSDAESGWTVARIAVEQVEAPEAGGGKARPEGITAVGTLALTQPGERLRLRGRWVQDRRFGEQLRVESHQTIRPATLLGMERYLGSGLVPGIGREMATRLVARFGLDTLEVIERHAERLTEVEGIGAVRSKRIREAWAEQRGVQEVMVFLATHGVSTSYALRIHRRYGAGAIGVVKADPYRLALEIHGIGFRMADAIAHQAGIPETSPRRAQAGVLHVLDEAQGSGHCYVPREALVTAAAALLIAKPGDAGEAPAPSAARAPSPSPQPSIVGTGAADFAALCERAVDDLGVSGRVVTDKLSDEEGGGQAVYLPELHKAEREMAGRLQQVLATPSKLAAIDVAKALAWLAESSPIRLAEAQALAVGRALVAKALVITGGPGTGKTTIVNGLLRVLEQSRRRVLLAAPTGRAAKRLAQATGREAKTLHRLLEFAPPKRGPQEPANANSSTANTPPPDSFKPGFQRDAKRPLECDVLIVDEASMLDQPLAHSLLAAVPPASQLILVGDVDQLPSVGPGSVLNDVIRSGVAPVVRLTEIFRQAQASLIVRNAHRIHHGELPETSPTDAGDFFLVERETPEEILATLKELVTVRIPRRFGLDPRADVQVLTPMVRGPLGAQRLNAELQALINPPWPGAPPGASVSGVAGAAPKPELVRVNRTLREGDKVMQVRNNYDSDVFNGDLGSVVRVDEKARTLVVRFDDREVPYDAGDLDELQLAYACTIHKAQGSEYPAVVIPLHTQHFVMLERNLLYTAVTRGKRVVVVVGSRRALAIAVRTRREGERKTRLAWRLTN